MVAEKDFHAPKHPEVDVPNLHVIKALTVSKANQNNSCRSGNPTYRPSKPPTQKILWSLWIFSTFDSLCRTSKVMFWVKSLTNLV